MYHLSPLSPPLSIACHANRTARAERHKRKGPKDEAKLKKGRESYQALRIWSNLHHGFLETLPKDYTYMQFRFFFFSPSFLFPPPRRVHVKEGKHGAAKLASELFRRRVSRIKQWLFE